jgi:hypothetical protein
MKINELQQIMDSRSKAAAEKAVGFDLKKDIWEACKALKKEYGKRVNEWPEHWVAILQGQKDETKNPPSQITREGGATEEGGVPKQKDLKQGRRNKPQFHSLTEEDVEWIIGVYNMDGTSLEKYKQMHEKYGIEARTSSWWWGKLGLTNKQQKNEPEYLKLARNRVLSDKKIHFFTGSQNATPIFEAGFKSMLTLAKVYDAEVHVIPYRIKNPTSVFTDIEHDHWPTEVIKYLDDTRHKLAENLLVCSDIKIQPTHHAPLSGLQAYTDGNTAVVAHPRFQMRSSAVLQGQHKQRLWTTGSISLKNYTDSFAGKKGESFHCMGFLVVEIDGDGTGDNFHIRQVSICEDGSLQDLWYCVDGEEVRTDGKVIVARFGDIHTGKHVQEKIDASIELCNILEPQFVVLDDVLDGSSGYLCHHEKNDKVAAFHKIKAGKFSIQKEVEEVVELVKYISDEVPMAQTVVLRSNHDIWLDKLVRSTDWRDDPYNADFFTNCLGILLNKPDIIGLLPYFLTEALGDRVICLGLDDSFSPDGSQHLHGHEGRNGSRGSLMQFSTYSSKVTSNHDHTPGRLDGAMSAGSSCLLRMGYNTGASGHGHGDVFSYLNEKRANIIYNSKFKFTTLPYPI